MSTAEFTQGYNVEFRGTNIEPAWSRFEFSPVTVIDFGEAEDGEFKIIAGTDGRRFSEIDTFTAGQVAEVIDPIVVENDRAGIIFDTNMEKHGKDFTKAVHDTIMQLAHDPEVGQSVVSALARETLRRVTHEGTTPDGKTTKFGTISPLYDIGEPKADRDNLFGISDTSEIYDKRHPAPGPIDIPPLKDTDTYFGKKPTLDDATLKLIRQYSPKPRAEHLITDGLPDKGRRIFEEIDRLPDSNTSGQRPGESFTDWLDRVSRPDLSGEDILPGVLGQLSEPPFFMLRDFSGIQQHPNESDADYLERLNGLKFKDLDK